jgi:hypothetical protein
MINALSADAPEPALTASLHLFGQFVGSWDLEWHGKDRQGNSITAAGELHVGWILGGRALQDVWRVPLNPADASMMRAFHGTTIRFYDPSIEAWRSTWLDPLNGRVRRFIGRPVGVTLLLTGSKTTLWSDGSSATSRSTTFTGPAKAPPMPASAG